MTALADPHPSPRRVSAWALKAAITAAALLTTGCQTSAAFVDHLEPGRQGEVLPEDARVLAQPYAMGVRVVGHEPIQGRPGNIQLSWIDHCAYVSSSAPGLPGGVEDPERNGVAVIDVSDPSAPRLVRVLRDNGSIHALETMHAVDAGDRKVLVAGSYRGGNAAFRPDDPPWLDIYDASDCENPRLMAEYRWPQNSHTLTLSPDGRRVYGTNQTAFTGNGALQVLDITDLANPRFMGRFGVTTADGRTSDFNVHEFSFSADERRIYAAVSDSKVGDFNAGIPEGPRAERLSPDAGGVYIIDNSDIVDGRPNPQLRLISAVPHGGWHSVMPANINGVPYLVGGGEIVACPGAVPTQSFNTTTSMGRLTLNVLLSFAQFEREVTGERIRDKIAASKAKGMWMGGNPMLGYDPDGRTLKVNPGEAETVRTIFQRYLELGSVHDLAADLKSHGIHAKRWTNKKGGTSGGGVLARGALYHLLRNRHYLGEIVHKGKPHPGQHDAIVGRELFDAVQAKLADNIGARKKRRVLPGGSHLTGLVFDDAGHAMSPTHARGKSGAAHRYYVSKALLTGQRDAAGSLARVAAKQLEAVVVDRLSIVMHPGAFAWGAARELIKRIVIGSQAISIELSDMAAQDSLTESLPAGDSFNAGSRTITIPMRLGRRAGAVRLLDPNGRRVVDRAEPEPTLINAIARGWRWRALLLDGSYATSSALAEAEGMTQTALHRYVRLAYLAPDLLREILDGRQRPGLTVDQLFRTEIPLSWDAQRRLFGAAR